MNKKLSEKFAALKSIIKSFNHVIVAYSGGVDSSFLLKASVDTLGEKASGVLAISSRFPYGEEINETKLKMVDQMETMLYHLGFNDIRARHSNNKVTIEVRPDQVKRFADDNIKIKVLKKAKEIGYKQVMIHMEGYRQGKLNSVFEKNIPSDTTKLTLFKS